MEKHHEDGHKPADKHGGKDDAHKKPELEAHKLEAHKLEAHKLGAHKLGAPQHPPPGGTAKHHEEGHKPADKHGGKDDTHKKPELEAHKLGAHKLGAPQHPPPGGIAKHHEEGHKPADKHGGKDDAHKKPELEAHKLGAHKLGAPQHPPPGGIAKHHEEGHKPVDKHGGKDDAHKKPELEAHKPEKDHKLHGDKAGGGKPEAKPGEKPHVAAAAPTAGLIGAPAGHGPLLEGAAAPVGKSSSWWKSLRHFFRRKPEDEESTEEEGVHHREMDEEFIECAGDLGAAGEVAHESHKGGAAGGAADAAAAPRQYKLNACLLVTSGAVIFVVLLAVLLSGDLFDDLDNSVPTFNIDLGKVVNVLDDVGFLGAGMNSSIMGKPGSWRPLLERQANDSLVLLLRGLAPAVLRFAGHETDHFYFVDGEDDGNSSHGGTDEGGTSLARQVYAFYTIRIWVRLCTNPFARATAAQEQSIEHWDDELDNCNSTDSLPHVPPSLGPVWKVSTSD
ncbi:hypothetical protein MTO96_006134 [Rhipicephalus appendiculatus]